MVDDLALARALHILGVVIWIGGVSMATSVALTAVRRGELGPDYLKAFQTIERRFVWQARIAVLVVGATGFYMTAKLDLWDRFRQVSFWWMDAMVAVWAIFAFVLFIAEPFFLHRHFEHWVHTAPDAAFAWLHRAHWVLLALALITIFGAVAGSHGWALL
jgi:hypothetical protein